MDSPADPVVVVKPSARLLPIGIDSPHSGTDYPADFASRPAALAAHARMLTALC